MPAFRDYPAALRYYLVAVITVGPMLAVAVAAFGGMSFQGERWLQAASLVVLAAAADRFPLHLRRTTELYLASAAYVAMILVFPASLPGLLALLGVTASQAWRRADMLGGLFNIGQTAFYVTAAAVITDVLRRTIAIEPWYTSPGFTLVGNVVLLVVASVSLHVVNSALVSLATTFQLRLNFVRVLRQNLLDNGSVHVVLATLGGASAVIISDHPYLVPVLGLPLALVYRATRDTVRLRDDTQAALEAMVDILELRDPYTAGHSRRVAATSYALALRLGLTPEEAKVIETAGVVHDIGKVVIDSAVLSKPDALSAEEWQLMRLHPVFGARVVERFAAYGNGFRLVRHHHEAWNGTGYPDGLKGEDIPLGARILAVADTFDALTSHRPYRQALTVDAALQILDQGAGRQWDANIVALLQVHVEATASSTAVSATQAATSAA